MRRHYPEKIWTFVIVLSFATQVVSADNFSSSSENNSTAFCFNVSKPDAEYGFFQQLCEFNANWNNYRNRVPCAKRKNIASDKEYVQMHLSAVLEILKSNNTEHLSDTQLKTRTFLMNELEKYRKAGNFPINYYRTYRVPVFIDEHNTHCAVGYLLQQSGHEDLAQYIAATDNYVWVKDIREKELLDWQQWSGFTLDELKLIQGAYFSYMENARVLPNRIEIPQKPEPVVLYFEGKAKGKPENVWLKGEGENGILDGKWEQNYAAGIPWIIGYYENGKRAGQWMEYYKGTKQLCRTEIWRNDKLNGYRKRYGRDGKLIEEILFENGNAIKKINYDYTDSLTWVRKPLDSVRVYSELYTFGGALLARGHERIYNPGNLMWFQNIELTSLNMMALSVKRAPSVSSSQASALFEVPPLVEYHKEGDWVFYKEYNVHRKKKNLSVSLLLGFTASYAYFLKDYRDAFFYLSESNVNFISDSICIKFSENRIEDFYWSGKQNDYHHVRFSYHDAAALSKLYTDAYDFEVAMMQRPVKIKRISEYDQKKRRTGEWKYYDIYGNLRKTETYLVPEDEEKTEPEE